MTWGNSSNVSTTNLDSATDNPAAARPDLKAALDELTNVIDGRATANGVASLDANGKVPSTQMPDEINSTSATNLTLDPATGKVALEEILNLKPQTVAQLNARTDIAQGDVAFCSDGDSGAECIAVAVAEDDSAGNPTWKVVTIGSAIST